MTQESNMDFPFETTTKGGRKATVLGVMPDGRLAGFAEHDSGFLTASWDDDGEHSVPGFAITLPLQIKPLTTYRMRNGEIAWTSGLIVDGWIRGMTRAGNRGTWRVSDGRWGFQSDRPEDLIEELPPGTTA